MKILLTFFIPVTYVIHNDSKMLSYINDIVGSCPDALKPARTKTNIVIKAHEEFTIKNLSGRSKPMLRRLHDFCWISDCNEEKFFVEKPENNNKEGVYVTVYSLTV